jgi:rubrerythrin
MNELHGAPGLDFALLSPCDALDLAILIEEEARDRYDELALQLLVHHTPEAATFFRKMAHAEELHREELVRRRRESFGDRPRTIDRSLLFDVEAPDYDEVRAFMTLRDALVVALRSEQKAHAFFDQAARESTDASARSLFEELRAEEHEHQEMVRGELARLAYQSACEAYDAGDEPTPQ